MSSMQKNEPWRNAERHYCAICNAWMGSDRQSILIHENGKKHQEKLKESLKQRQQNKIKQERQKNELEKSLMKMQQIANIKHAQDSMYFGNINQVTNASLSSNFVSGISCVPVAPTKGTMQQQNLINQSNETHKSKKTDKTLSKKEIESWQDRKKRRDQSENDEDTTSEPTKKKAKQIKLGQNEGHYVIDKKTYLEGKSIEY